jgi:iron complex transport system substrate-binding protein
VLFLVAGCGGAAATPRASAHPVRIVSLLPAITETVTALGAGERLVGCTIHCTAPAGVARVPWQEASAAETILRLDPDLVLRQRLRAPEDPLRAALEAGGVPVVALPTETVADVRALFGSVGEAIGATGEAKALLERFDAELAAVRAEFSGRERPSVLFVFGRDPGAAANVHAAGPGSFLDELIDLAGGRNAIADLKDAYAAVPLEELVRRAPRVIIDNMPPEADAARALDAWSGVRAMVPGIRVHPVLGNDLLLPGPRLPASVRTLANLIHERP